MDWVVRSPNVSTTSVAHPQVRVSLHLIGLSLTLSLGGLIALGIFLMQWSPSECLRRFEEMATTTFRLDDASESLTWSQKLQRLFRVCLQDHRYNLTPIEKVFQTKSGSTTKMFNPLQSDTKVAVTTTSVRENVAGVISNYNYGPRLDATSQLERVKIRVILTQGSISPHQGSTASA